MVHPVPGNAHAVFDIAGVAGMQSLPVTHGRRQPLLRGHQLEALGRTLLEVIAADDDSLLCVECVGGILHLTDVLAGPGNPTVDAFLLPEALAHLKGDLADLSSRSGDEPGLQSTREIVVDA